MPNPQDGDHTNQLDAINQFATVDAQSVASIKKRLQPRWRQQHREKKQTQTLISIAPCKHACLESPQLIKTQQGLQDAIREIRLAKCFAFDTEFIGEDAYSPRICLLQIATETHIWLIDPLSDIDITPIWNLINDPEIMTIVHSGRQDLLFAYEATGKLPQNIIDTQIASAFAGLPWSLGLKNMTQQLLEIDLGHCAKVTTWDARPLLPLQLQYAANDVRYLIACHRTLQPKIDSFSNDAYVNYANQSAVNTLQSTIEAPLIRFKIKNLKKISLNQRCHLRALILWREAIAKKINLPARSIAPDGALFEIIKLDHIDHPDTLHQIPDLPSPIVDQFFDQIKTLLSQKHSLDMPESEKKPRLSEKKRQQTQILAQQWWLDFQKDCSNRGIDSAVITSGKEMLNLLLNQVANKPTAHYRLKNENWRWQLALNTHPLN